MEQPKLKYLQDDDGNRTHVILPIEYYESLLEELESVKDNARYDQAKQEDTGERINLSEMKERLGLV